MSTRGLSPEAIAGNSAIHEAFTKLLYEIDGRHLGHAVTEGIGEVHDAGKVESEQ